MEDKLGKEHAVVKAAQENTQKTLDEIWAMIDDREFALAAFSLASLMHAFYELGESLSEISVITGQIPPDVLSYSLKDHLKKLEAWREVREGQVMANCFIPDDLLAPAIEAGAKAVRPWLPQKSRTLAPDVARAVIEAVIGAGHLISAQDHYEALTLYETGARIAESLARLLRGEPLVFTVEHGKDK